MSKIALSPDAAGTGTFTLASPSGNTNRTITLPDATGTLVASDASGNVDVTGTLTSDGLLVQSTSGSTTGTIRSDAGSNSVLYLDTQDTSSASYITASGSLAIATGSGTPERLRVDSSGNVGIGTSSPDTKLVVANGSDTLKSNLDSDSIDLFANGKTFNLGTTSNNVVRFFENNSERMRISSGNLLVGKTAESGGTAGHFFSSSGYARATRNGSMSLLNRLTSNGSAIDFQKNGTGVGSISVTGSATAFNTSSDYRLKTDAQSMTGASARVQALNPVNFEWLADGSRVDGFLAHEAQAVVPEAVHGTKDAMKDEEYEVTPAVLDEDGNETTAAVMGTRSVPDYQGIDQSKLVPLLTAALQEALTKIDDMETRLAALEVTP